MSNEKMTHAEFVDFCKASGIPVVRITRSYVYMEKGSKSILPNECLVRDLGNAIIYSTWEDNTTGRTLKEYIKSNMKIGAIKIIRAKTKFGLRDSKDIADANWQSWQRMFGVGNET